MRAFEDYNSTKEYTPGGNKLPAGAYEVKIIKAEDVDNALCILFDISSGEYKNYFHKKFDSDRENYPENAKYKGVYRMYYPQKGDSKERIEASKRRRKTVLKTINDTNNLNIDFTKEWDGAALKGAVVGMIFRDKEYDYNGHHGFSAQPYGVISAEDLKNGNYTIPDPYYLDKPADTGSSGASGYNDVDSYLVDSEDDDDLPF